MIEYTDDGKTYVLQVYPAVGMTKDQREDLRVALLNAYPASIDKISHVTIYPAVALDYKES